MRLLVFTSKCEIFFCTAQNLHRIVTHKTAQAGRQENTTSGPESIRTKDSRASEKTRQESQHLEKEKEGDEKEKVKNMGTEETRAAWKTKKGKQKGGEGENKLWKQGRKKESLKGTNNREF